MSLLKNVYLEVFEIAETEFEIKISKCKISGLIWPRKNLKIIEFSCKWVPQGIWDRWILIWGQNLIIQNGEAATQVPNTSPRFVIDLGICKECYIGAYIVKYWPQIWIKQPQKPWSMHYYKNSIFSKFMIRYISSRILNLCIKTSNFNSVTPKPLFST